MLVAVAAVETVVLADGEGVALVDGILWTYGLAGAAADAGLRDLVTLGFQHGVSHGEILPRDGARAETEVLDGVVLDDKHRVDVLGLAWIDVLQVGLLLVKHVAPFHLLVPGHLHGLARNADGLLVAGVAQNLHSPVGLQLSAETLAASREEVDVRALEVDGADVAHLRGTVLIHRGEVEHADET